MLKDQNTRLRYALQLIEAGLDSKLICKAAGISLYEYNQVMKGHSAITYAA